MNAKIKNNRTVVKKYLNKINTIITKTRGKIPITLQCIVALPGDNFEGLKKTLNQYLNFKPDQIYMSWLKVLPRSQYFKDKESLSIKSLNSSNYDILENFSFSCKELQKSMCLVNAIALIYNFNLFRRTFYAIAQDLEMPSVDIYYMFGEWLQQKYPNSHVIQMKHKFFMDRDRSYNLIHDFLHYIQQTNKILQQSVIIEDILRFESIIILLNKGFGCNNICYFNNLSAYQKYINEKHNESSQHNLANESIFSANYFIEQFNFNIFNNDLPSLKKIILNKFHIGTNFLLFIEGGFASSNIPSLYVIKFSPQEQND